MRKIAFYCMRGHSGVSDNEVGRKVRGVAKAIVRRNTCTGSAGATHFLGMMRSKKNFLTFCGFLRWKVYYWLLRACFGIINIEAHNGKS